MSEMEFNPGNGSWEPKEPRRNTTLEDTASLHVRDWWVVVPSDSGMYAVQADSMGEAHAQHRRTEQWETTKVLGPFTSKGATEIVEFIKERA